jgi:hypothetical protein
MRFEWFRVRKVRRHCRYICIFLLLQVSKEVRMLWEEFDVERGIVTKVSFVERFFFLLEK